MVTDNPLICFLYEFINIVSANYRQFAVLFLLFLQWYISNNRKTTKIQKRVPNLISSFVAKISIFQQRPNGWSLRILPFLHLDER